MKPDTKAGPAVGQDPHLDPVPLLQMYESVLRAVDRLGPVARLGLSRRDPSRSDILPRRCWGWLTRRQPAVRLLLRPMIHHHIRRRTEALKAIFDRRAAASADERPVEKARGERVEEFGGSLRAPRTRLLVLAHLLAVFALVVAMASLLPAPLRNSVLQALDRLFDLFDGFGWASARAAGQETLNNGVVGLVWAAILAVPAVVIVGQLPLCAFRLKRALLNLAPNPLHELSSAPPRSHLRRATGIYVEEARLFGALDSRTPGEFPWDLLPRLGWFVLLSLVFWPTLDLTFERPFGVFDLGLNVAIWGGILGWVAASIRIGGRRRHPRHRGLLASPGWVGDDPASGAIRLEGSRLSFHDGAGVLVFDRHWSELPVVHVARDHTFGQGIVLRTSDRQRHEVALMEPELSGVVKGFKGWVACTCVLLALAIVATSTLASLLFWVAGALAILAAGRRALVLVAHRGELRRAGRAIRCWKAALEAWP